MTEAKFHRIKYYDYESCLSPFPVEDLGICLLYKLLQDFAIARHILIRELIDPDSRGINSSRIVMELEGKRAFLWSQFDEEENKFELDRKHLSELVNKWDFLCKKDVEMIVIRRDGERFEIEEVQSN